ncbi:hypothetical protein OPV22_022898 [Ensete ventricosum]|uniref:RING-type domain-containing protein n=1 Tax=Ensete ventricosum TaxID=4639 RepID=A0AAV8QKQ9_ENSVE|nr:hypothetical protein OPV22_022898 [Ensete ventricosum]RWW23961.1 hypothetical protein GW17_00011773 [Ensete ventricosum]RWW89384.1 hypothetical protein BHE74_00001678 [Ensete ventricosum]
MGLHSLPSAAEAFFPFALLAYALLPVALLVDGVTRAVVRMIRLGGGGDGEEERMPDVGARVEVWRHEGGVDAGECCVCLHGFEAEAEVSQVVACRHFFHRECLERWLSHLHSTCPLCRSMV